MAVKTDAELLTQALQIKSEIIENANTATRVGQLFQDMVDSKSNVVEESFIVRHVGDVDLAATDLFPSVGTAATPASNGTVQAHNRYYNTSAGLTSTLLDKYGNPIPGNVFIEAKIDNPRTDNVADWYIYYLE